MRTWTILRSKDLGDDSNDTNIVSHAYYRRYLQQTFFKIFSKTYGYNPIIHTGAACDQAEQSYQSLYGKGWDHTRVAPERIAPPLEADERTTLTAFLDFQRATLAVKCDGLTDDQLREQAVLPSGLSLLGIVRHMAEVERNWFRPVLGGEEMSTIFAPGMDWEAAFRDVATASVPEAFSTWRAECEHSCALVAAAPSLDVSGNRGGGRFSLRWVLAHMIEEYARHNGHADLLRERLDGSTGD
jgi:hypothetical protein